MGQVRGTLHWDDDSLSPGKRSNGDWSQNLFDPDGNLRTHASFTPDPDSDDGNSAYSPYDDPPMSMSSETRRESADEEDVESRDNTADQLAKALVLLVGAAAIAGVTYATPRIKNWAEETALPFIKSTVSKVRLPWEKKQDENPAPEGTDVVSSPLATIGRGGAGATHAPLQIEAKREKMSNAEAQARLMAAAAARLFAEEQTRLVLRSDIVDAADVDELRAQIAMHPREKLETLLQHLARNPRLLEDTSLAQLASILDRNSLGLDAAQQECASLPSSETSNEDSRDDK